MSSSVIKLPYISKQIMHVPLHLISICLAREYQSNNIIVQFI